MNINKFINLGYGLLVLAFISEIFLSGIMDTKIFAITLLIWVVLDAINSKLNMMEEQEEKNTMSEKTHRKQINELTKEINSINEKFYNEIILKNAIIEKELKVISKHMEEIKKDRKTHPQKNQKDLFENKLKEIDKKTHYDDDYFFFI